jgi:pimeloyl-ACP methyl ester carboxylesterase
MERAKVNGAELEYQIHGSGEPVLLIDMLLPDSVLPLTSEPALADRYQLIRYHKRGWVGSTHTPGPVSIADQAADAAALLGALGVARAHVVGHSSGASIALQMTLDQGDKVHTLTVLEPTFVSLPNGQAFVQGAGPVFEAYANGDHARAIAMFVSAATGIDWDRCTALLEERIPGIVTQTTKDADTFFGIELPSLVEWSFGKDEASRVNRPTLSVFGEGTAPVWTEIAAFLRESLPYVEEASIPRVTHLLQMQDPKPVAEAIAGFLKRNPMNG